jgi:hypothetical protein
MRARTPRHTAGEDRAVMLRYPAPLQPGDRHLCGRTRPQARRIVAARRRQPRDARRQPAVLRLRPADDSLPDAASQVLREMRAAVDEGVEQLLDDAGGVPEHLMPGVATRCSVAKPSGMASTASWALLGGTSGSCSPTMTSTGQRTAAKPARRSMSGIDGEVSVHLRGAGPSPPREPPRRRATTAAAWSGRSRSSGRPPLRTRGSAHRRR